MNQLASDLNDSNTNESSTSESSNQSTSQQTTNNTTSQTAQEEQATSNKDRQQSEDVLDALLDKYSDKAQQTHKDYTSSKKTKTSQASQNEDSKRYINNSRPTRHK